MEVIGINRILGWCQILGGASRRYTCPTKLIDGKLHFLFKKEWHPIKDYLSHSVLDMIKKGRPEFYILAKGNHLDNIF